MSIENFLQESVGWLSWAGLVLIALTLIGFIFNWGIKFRLVGVTVFTLLLAGSSWAFSASYTPPVVIEGAKYAPIVYDNGYDLLVAQALDDFPEEAINPTLQQIAGNIKGGGRNGALVHVRLRKLESGGDGVSKPKILGEVIRDTGQNITIDSKNSTDAE